MQEIRPLRIGFIGGSVHSAVGYVHFCASRMDNRWELVSGCFSKNPEDNLETAKVYGVMPERVYPNWQKFLESEVEKVDAVSVLTPTPDHFQIVKVCLEMGIPTICEKALASNSQEIAELINIKNRFKGFLAVTYNYSFYPIIRELKAKIDGKELGDILHFQITMPQQGYLKKTKAESGVQGWRLNDSVIPVIYTDLGVHMHQLVDYLIEKKPLKVVAQEGSFGSFSVIDNVTILCEYERSIHGSYWFSKSAIGHRNGLSISIYGTKGSATWLQADPETLKVAYADGTINIVDRSCELKVANQAKYNRFKPGHPAGFLEAFANLYYHLADDLQLYLDSGEWSASRAIGPETAYEGMIFLEATLKSARNKDWNMIRF